MNKDPRLRAVIASFGGAIGLCLSAPGLLEARERLIVPGGWQVGSLRIEGGRTTATRGRGARLRLARGGGLSSRELTVNRAFPSYLDRNDPLEFGSTIYGDIRSLDPYPTVTSGTQLPFGLDGIGGFGSDVGFSAGANAALYDRGE